MSVSEPTKQTVKKSPAGLLQIQQLASRPESRRGMGSTLGFRIADVAIGEVTMEGMPSDDHLNPNGTVHGGYAATILDSSIGLAVHTHMTAEMGYGTTDLSVTFMRPLYPDSGPVRAVGTVIHMGRRMAVCEARLTDKGGRLCAVAKGTCFLFPLNKKP